MDALTGRGSEVKWLEVSRKLLCNITVKAAARLIM
jgi:hypothetical protein